MTASAPPPTHKSGNWIQRDGRGGERGWPTRGIPVDREIEGIDFDQVAVPGIFCDSDIVVTQFLLYALSVDVLEFGLAEPQHCVPLLSLSLSLLASGQWAR